MKKMEKNALVFTILLSLATFGLATQATSQSLQLSRNADFSTNDGLFVFSDILHAKVIAPQIDFFDIKDNEFRLKPSSGNDDNDVEGAFTNNFDGTYETQIPLSGIDRSQSSWEFRAKVRDDNKGRFEARITITIQNTPGAGDSLVVTAQILSLGANFLNLPGNTVFVDSATAILENGLPLPFISLQNGWKVTVFAERRNDGRLWATSIIVLERDNSGQEVETRGIIASIDSASIIVNNIKFIVVSSTEILDRENNRIGLASLKVGVFVEARGILSTNGDVIAKKIKIEDDDIGGDEIELVGHIDFILADSARQFISVKNTLFEINANTVLLGFDNEAIKLSDLRVGELVEVKARTRAGQTPLAERIKREDKNGEDIEIKGTILALGDSTLTVGQLTFHMTPNTIILDDNNQFIRFSDLRTGLIVEVRANAAANGTLVATRIKVEDGSVDQIEVKGFVDALTDSSVTISGLLFFVDSATVVIGEDGNTTGFEILQVGMLVEVRGDIGVSGKLHATQIKIEDFLQDEIEIRGAISALGTDSLLVTGITFFVDSATQITDRNGLPVGLQALVAGMIVEIRADLKEGRWVASRIQIEDRIDTVVEIRGKIDSLATNTIFMLSRKIATTNATIFLDRQNLPVTFAALVTGDFVEVKAQLLSDSSLVALRVKQEDNDDDEVELTGTIHALSQTSITVSGQVFSIDAATVFLDHTQQPVTIQQLHLGMVVEVKARKQSDGTFLAVRVQVENRRSITGFITALAGGTVAIQGISHSLTENSLISDSQNRIVNAQSLKVNQLVQVVARANQSRQEIIKIRIMAAGTTTGIDHEPSAVITDFRLMQNYPNPFNPSTVIRFALPQADFARLVIYDLLGRRIRTLVDDARPAGEHEVIWDSRDDFGNLMASGVYFYRLEVNGLTRTRKLTLIR
jgi:hypothetical protein